MTRVPLDELIISDESGFACSKSKLVETGLPHLRPFNITDAGNLYLTDLYQVPVDEAPRGKSSLEEGDVLFNNTNSAELVGKSALIGSPMVAGFSNHMTRIKVDRTRIEPAFFAYWLRRLRSTGYFTAHATQWVSQAAYKSSELRKLDLDLPPLPEQRRIVDLLSRAEGIVRLRREAEKKAAELIPALFIDMFGDPATNPKAWPVAKLPNVLNRPFKNGLYLSKEKYSNDGVEMVHMSDAFYGEVKRGGLRRVVADDKQIRDYGLTKNDLLIARRSLNFDGAAKLCGIPSSDEPLLFESSFIRLTPDSEKVRTDYLLHYLNNESTRRAHVLSRISGITISGINQAALNQIPVMTPPLPKQDSFVECVVAVDSIQSQQSTATTRAQAAFDALLAQAFQPAYVNRVTV